MRIYKLAIVCLVLFMSAGCGVGTCVTAENIGKLEVRDDIPTKPSSPKPGNPSTYWVKTQLEVDGTAQQVFSVIPKNVDLCYQTPTEVEISPGQQEVILPMLNDGEAIKFSLVPYFFSYVDDNICDNKNNQVSSESSDVCEKIFGTEISSKIGNGNKPKDNIFFPYTSVTHSTTQNGRKIDSTYPVKWIPGKMYVITPTDDIESSKSSEAYEDIQNKIKNGNGVIAGNYKCVGIELAYPSLFSKASEISTSLINDLCGYTCKEHDSWPACGYTEQTIRVPTSSEESWNTADNPLKVDIGTPDTETSVSYIQGLHVCMDSACKWQLKPWEDNLGSITYHGIRTMYPYFFPKDSTKIITKTSNNSMKLFFKLESDTSSLYTYNGAASGGYRIAITKDCSVATANSLYMYVGEEAPSFMPGEGSSKEIDFLNQNMAIIPVGAIGTLYIGVKDNGDGYDNNRGYFRMQALIYVKDRFTIVSTAVKYVKDKIMQILYGTNYQYGVDDASINSNYGNGIVGTIYLGIIKSHLVSVANALLSLYVVVYTLYYALGLTACSRLELLLASLKVSAVLILISPDSWEFFNKYLFNIFTKFPIELTNIVTSTTEASTEFGFLDKSLNRFSFSETWSQIGSLLFAFPLGWVIILVIFWGIWTIGHAIIIAVLGYFSSLVMLALFLSVAPLFIICVLFHRTKVIFDGWILALSDIAFQPVVLFCGIGLLNDMIMITTNSLLSFDACTGCVAEANWDLGDVGELKFCLIEFLLPNGFSPVFTPEDYNRMADYDGQSIMGIPIQIGYLIMFIAMARSLKGFTDQAAAISSGLFGTITSNFAASGEKLKESALGLVGMDTQSRELRTRQSIYEKANDTSAKGAKDQKKDDKKDSEKVKVKRDKK